MAVRCTCEDVVCANVDPELDSLSVTAVPPPDTLLSRCDVWFQRLARSNLQNKSDIADKLLRDCEFWKASFEARKRFLSPRSSRSDVGEDLENGFHQRRLLI